MTKQIQLAIAPIAWTNDDMPELGSENTFEQCISEMALLGSPEQRLATNIQRSRGVGTIFEYSRLKGCQCMVQCVSDN